MNAVTRHSIRGACWRAIAAAGLWLLGAPAQAVSVLPGETVVLTGTSALERPELAGTMATEALRPFVINMYGGGQITGTLHDRVLRNDTTGLLSFYTYISVDPGSDGYLTYFVRENYTGLATDADFRTDSFGSVAPDQVWRLPDTGGYDGSELRFDFITDTIDPGESSRYLFIGTNATAYDEGGLVFLIGEAGDGRNGNVTLSAFQPAPVPLPPAVWLLASGLLGVVATARRRLSPIPVKRGVPLNDGGL